MSPLNGPIRNGMQSGWKVSGGALGPIPVEIVRDVAISGSGAGAGITAGLLARAGLQVVVIQEGPLKSSSDFNPKESESHPSLYRESTARMTEDKSIHRLGSYTAEALAPYLAQAGQRLNMAPWLAASNEKNDLLRRGAVKLGIPVASIARNVKGCWNLGLCGLGCPTNAKQSMLVTTIPAALGLGAQLLTETRAERFELANGKLTALVCQNIEPNGDFAQSGRAQVAIKIIAKHCVLAGDAINSPAVLLRSGAPDPHSRLVRRTFSHPVVMSSSNLAQKVEAWSCAPESIYTDHFLQTQPIDGPMGYKLEAPPLHPLNFASTVPGFGEGQHAQLKSFPHSHTLLALLRDGFHDETPWGMVGLCSR